MESTSPVCFDHAPGYGPVLDISENNHLIQKMANIPEEQKVAPVSIQEEHLRLSAGERELHKNCCNQAKDNVQKHFREINDNVRREPCTYNGTAVQAYFGSAKPCSCS